VHCGDAYSKPAFVFVFAVITVQNFGVQQCYDLKDGHPILFRQQQHNGGAAEQQLSCLAGPQIDILGRLARQDRRKADTKPWIAPPPTVSLQTCGRSCSY